MITLNLNALKANIYKYYDADINIKRYKNNLLRYIKVARGKHIPTLAAWKKYVKEFTIIVG